MSKKQFHTILLFLFVKIAFAQTKVSGVVVDSSNEPIPFANLVFKGSTTGVVSGEDGKFYIESPENHSSLLVSFVGFPTQEVKLVKQVNYDFKIVLKEGNGLKEVKIYSGNKKK